MTTYTLRQSLGPLSGGTRVELVETSDGFKAGLWGIAIVRVAAISDALRQQLRAHSELLDEFGVDAIDLVAHDHRPKWGIEE